MNGYSFSYTRGKIRATHRNLSTILDMTEALESVGYKKSSTIRFTNNFSLQGEITNNLERPHIQIFDLHYISNPTALLIGTLLEDATPIVYEDIVGTDVYC